jgi:iron(II)-dependent oxidoreductase
LDLPAFTIGRYPVTVGQYRAFIDAGGYGEQRYWTKAGWQKKGGRRLDGARQLARPDLDR